MKIWCLRCGSVLAETGTQRMKNKEINCPACGLRLRFKVDRNVVHIVTDAGSKTTNHDLLIYCL